MHKAEILRYIPVKKYREYKKINGKRQNMKQLFKSSVNKKLCGVCGGIGEYFNVDPTIVRLIFVILGLWSGSGVILYIIAALLMPDE